MRKDNQRKDDAQSKISKAQKNPAVSSSDSETDAETPPLTDKGQDEIEPEDRPRIGDYILVKVPGKVTSPWQKLMETYMRLI